MRLLSTEASEQATGPITTASGRFDPFDSSFLQNPYPTLKSLQQEEPLFFSPDLKTWVVSRHATVKSILRDTQRFSASVVSDPLTPLCPHARQMIQDSRFDVPPMLVNNDPPSHTRYRKFFGEHLQLDRIQSLEPFVRETVKRYVDRLESGTTPVDLVAGLTWDIPALVLFKLIGVPDSDIAKVKAWADSRVVLTWGKPTDAEQIRLSAGTIDYFNYSRELVQRKLEAPGDDYISDLIRSRAGDDEKMSLHEITGMAFNLLFAGHETTSSAAVNLFANVLQRRDLWDRICRREQPLGPVIEESLRFDPPIQAWRRQVKVDVELEGQTVPAGSRILLLFAAANRDPSVYPGPDEFDPSRKNLPQHMAFGHGLHYCMGAPLARQELTAMLEEVSQRLPGMQIVPGQERVFIPNTSFRALQRLMVTW
jgi:cytochrome P450